jgi:hypothetical protein
MKVLLHSIFSLFLCVSAFAQEPRWGFLGDDEALELRIKEAKAVYQVCVYDVALQDVKPPFAKVVYKATVTGAYKGSHKIGDKISITFLTDSLSLDQTERDSFISKANQRLKGSLRFTFLNSQTDNNYFCEFMDVPEYSLEMSNFLESNYKLLKN